MSDQGVLSAVWCLMSDVRCLMSNTALSDVRYRLDLSPVKRSLTSPQFLVPHTTPICSKQPYVKESRFASSTRKSIFCWKHVPELLSQKRLKIGGAAMKWMLCMAIGHGQGIPRHLKYFGLEIKFTFWKCAPGKNMTHFYSFACFAEQRETNHQENSAG